MLNLMESVDDRSELQNFQQKGAIASHHGAPGIAGGGTVSSIRPPIAPDGK